MKKPATILLLGLLCCCLDNNVLSNNGIESLNSMIGENKWKVLRENILKDKIFSMPPSQQYHFQKNNEVYLIEDNIKSVKKHKGVWEINEKAGYFYMKMNWEKGEKYYSFFIEYEKTNNIIKSYQIIFYTGKNYRPPKSSEEFFGSSEYLVMATIYNE